MLLLLLLLVLVGIFTVVLDVSVNAKVFQILLSIFVDDRTDVKIINIEMYNNTDMTKGDTLNIKSY